MRRCGKKGDCGLGWRGQNFSGQGGGESQVAGKRTAGLQVLGNRLKGNKLIISFKQPNMRRF